MRIGIDVGGTKIEAVALDDDGIERFRRRIATPRGDYEATVAALVSLVADAEAVAGSATVGLGIPGAVSPATGLVKNANSTWLIGRPLLDDLRRALGRDVRLANDANCFALSEASDGAGAGAASVFGVIVGTGTGGGLVIAGRVVIGANAVAGEWGHNPMPWPDKDEWPGPPCYCGKTGCIETFLSGPALSAEYQRRTGRALLATQIAELAAGGVAAAEAAMACYEHRMARALATVINLVDPDVIVLGGGLSKIDRLYENVPRLWTAFVFSDYVATRLCRAVHGDSSGVRGAAWLWDRPGGQGLDARARGRP
jgi:fructokinase